MLAIRACGLVTCVGFNGSATLAALRAGVRGLKETNLWDHGSGTYLAAGRVPLPHWWIGVGKLVELVAPAILECFQAADPLAPADIPVLIGLPPTDRPARIPGIEENILTDLAWKFGHDLHPASRVVASDRVSLAVALQSAGELINRRLAQAVVIAGVDSLVIPELKNYYLSRQRLLTPRNSNGFSVGEAGSALLVMPLQPSGPQLEILAFSTNHEEATIESDKPLKATALTQVIGDALQQAGITIDQIDYRITDLNGEHYRFKEFTLASNRFYRQPRTELFDVWHPIESIGDVGAAIGPILLSWAFHAGLKGYASGPTALCTLSNDGGARAAVIARYRE